MHICVFFLISLCDKLLELKSKYMNDFILFQTKCREYVEKIQTIINSKDNGSDDKILFEDVIDSFNTTIELIDELSDFMKIKNYLKYFERVYELLEKSRKEIYKIENEKDLSAFYIYNSLSQKVNRLIRKNIHCGLKILVIFLKQTYF